MRSDNNSGISDEQINRIIIDPNDNDVLYAGVYNKTASKKQLTLCCYQSLWHRYTGKLLHD